MTIKAVFKAVYSDRDEVQLLVDRDYRNDIVTVTAVRFDDRISVTMPLDQYRELNRMIGIGP